VRRGPGDIFLNTNPRLGRIAVTKDTVTNQVPIPPKETKKEDNEPIRRSQVEQTEIPSGSKPPRKQSPRGSKRNRQSS